MTLEEIEALKPEPPPEGAPITPYIVGEHAEALHRYMEAIKERMREVYPEYARLVAKEVSSNGR